MSTSIPDDLGALDDVELVRLLERTVKEERRISARRSKLHDRLDFLRSGGGEATEGSASLLEKLTADERCVSAERKAIHDSISALEAERRRRHGA